MSRKIQSIKTLTELTEPNGYSFMRKRRDIHGSCLFVLANAHSCSWLQSRKSSVGVSFFEFVVSGKDVLSLKRMETGESESGKILLLRVTSNPLSEYTEPSLRRRLKVLRRLAWIVPWIRVEAREEHTKNQHNLGVAKYVYNNHKSTRLPSRQAGSCPQSLTLVPSMLSLSLYILKNKHTKSGQY